jgi:nitroreductase
MIRAMALIGLATLALALPALAQEPSDIRLPGPAKEGGMPLMQALWNRHSTREFAEARLPDQVLSNLLFAAAGINRPDGKRTAPSARNWQEVEVYAVLPDGAYLYDAKENVLKGVAKGDLRKLAGVQDFVAVAPLNLIYVADASKLADASPADQSLYSGADTGFMAENVYLLCASEGLNVVVRASVDRKALGQALKLPEQKHIILAQTIGYPAGEKKTEGTK